MLVGAILFVVVGVVALLLTRSAAYRSRMVDNLTRQADLKVPDAQRPALEARLVRRSWATGLGFVLAGLVTLVAHLVGVDTEALGGWGLFSLAVVLAVALLAVVEIWWPGTPVAGPRTARPTAPRAGDYVPPVVSRGFWVLTGLGLVAVAGSLLMGRSRWFDSATLWNSALPLLLVTLPVLLLLTVLAVRRVLDAPQPARDETELYWQDALRSSAVSSLLVPPALVGLLALLVAGAALDDAASVAAVATGEVGPAWTLGLLVIGYAAPFVILIAFLLLTTGVGGRREVGHMRDRLWGGRIPRAQGADTGAGAG